MRTGYADTIKDPDIEKPLDSDGLSSSRGSSSGGGNGFGGSGGNSGGDNDDGEDKYLPLSDRDKDFYPDRSIVLTWFLLLVVLMTFGGLIAAYIVISTNKAAEWKPFDLPRPVWISTILILMSSITFHFAQINVIKDDVTWIRRFFIATSVLGGAFMGSQLLAWIELISRKFYISGDPYAGFFYIMTVLHALHVLGGICALGYIMLRCWYPTRSSEEKTYRENLTRSTGMYWHFVGGLWIILLVLLGFWT